MKNKYLWLLSIITLINITLFSACAAKTTTKQTETEKVVQVTRIAEKEVAKPIPTPNPNPARQANQPGNDSDGNVLPSLYRANRMIIKNAELQLLVDDTNVAIDQTTQIAADTFGYILSSRTWYKNKFQYATITIGVPVNEFENAIRRLRGLAIRVLEENASGTDVTDQYVDLESRLRNLEATEARIRAFLDQATTVEESLRVNQTLTEITAQIEKIKGQMNYFQDRAAYSTITVHISPQVPTPTPIPTATPTPTPTPVAWRPDKTFQSAVGTLSNIIRTIVDAAIWIIVLFGPFVIPIALVVWLGIRFGNRRRKSKPVDKE